jgi:formate dehydrogenase (NADP+) beta subunit
LETIRLNIDGRDIETQKGRSILEAALVGGIYIPHLCHHPDLSPIGACKLCVVEVDEMEGLVSSCTTAAVDGMIVKTKNERIDHMRRLAMELLLAGHPPDCGTCIKYLNCELQSIKQYLAGDRSSARRRSKLFPYDATNPLFVRDPNKCVLCGRCVRACHELRGAGVLFYKKKGKETYIGTANDLPLADSGCRFCGACAEVCPCGAIMDKEEFGKGKSRKSALVPCRYTCPAEIDVPRYVRFMGEKNYSAAAAVIREKAPFPGVLGYVCDHPCERVCRRGEVNQPISIRNLKRYAAEHDEKRTWEKNPKKRPSTGKKIAIIGSGPAGLTAAYYLTNQGHETTIFEALPLPGGMLRYGIPEYRLPRDVLDSEIRDIENRGVEIRTNRRIESIDELFDQGYDAVLVAVGSHKGRKLSVPGANHEAVLIGTDFLKDVHTGKRAAIGNEVMVLGGGNVAIDCARVARRLGAEKAHLVCLEGEADMPASGDEIEQGREEGIVIHPSRAITRILDDNGKIIGAEFLDVASFGFDEDKTLHVEVIENSHHVLTADTVIFAIGQEPEIPEGFGLSTTAGHLMEIDSYTLATSRDGVFATGDAVSGTMSLIQAIASGRKSAIAVDQFLGGAGNIEETLAPASEPEKYLGPGEGFASMIRCEESCPAPEERLRGSCAVNGLDEEKAAYESKRCLQCDLRLKMKPVKFWGNY